MGILDVKIEIATSHEWGMRNLRLKRIKSMPVTGTQVTQPTITNSDLSDPSSSAGASANGEIQPTNLPQDHQRANDQLFMPLQLYSAATKNDVDGLVGVLEQISAERGLAFSEILELLTPAGNTLLHVATSSKNKDSVKLLAYHAPYLFMKQNAVGDTALHLAARARNYLLVDLLLLFLEDSGNAETGNLWSVSQMGMPDKGDLLRLKNIKGNTALHECIMKQHDSDSYKSTGVKPIKWLFRCSNDKDIRGMSYCTWICDRLTRTNPEICHILNNEGKSPLYLAAEVDDQECVKFLVTKALENHNREEMFKGESSFLAAINYGNIEVLDIILDKEPSLINLKDKEGRIPVHHAASTGHIDVVQYLLGKGPECALVRDDNGFFPIHIAAAHGYTHVLEELLQHCLHPSEMLTGTGQNILHIAAAGGKLNIVSFIFQTPTLQSLINQQDHNGNMPLHLAVINWRPKITTTMTWDRRVNLEAVNNEGLTALDTSEYYMETPASFQKRLTWAALKAANAPRAPRKKAFNRCQRDPSEKRQSPTDEYKDRVNTLLVVATLVATVTFAAGFTMPGGYNNSEPNQGMATMLQRRSFHVFIFCDTIAMYSSILVVISLIWAQLGDIYLVLIALRLAIPLLGIGLAMMALAFMAGVYLVVSQLHWLAYAVFTMGSAILGALLLVFFPLCLPISSGNRILHYASYYPFQLLLLVNERCSQD